MVFNTVYYTKRDPNRDKTTEVTAYVTEHDYTSFPSSISVILTRDGGHYDTAELGDSNNWIYAWGRLPEAIWSVVPEAVNGFRVSVELANSNGRLTCFISYEPETA